MSKMKVKVLLEVEGRLKILQLQHNTVTSLRASFEEMCRGDPVLRNRIITHYPTFVSFSSSFQTDVELENSDELVDGQRVKTHFAAYAAVETPTVPAEEVPSSAGITTTNNDLNYIHLIGMRTPAQDPAAVPGTSTSSQSTDKRPVTAPAPSTSTSRTESTTKKSKTSRRVTRQFSEKDRPEESDSDGYFDEAMEARKKNKAVLEGLSIVAAKRITLPKKKTNKKKGESTLPSRSQPLRALRCQGPLEMEKENVDPDDDFTDDLFNNLGGSNKESEKSEKSKKRKPQKRIRMIGERITKNTPLPPFPDDLIESLRKGQVYVSQSHTRKMNTFLKGFVLSTTKDKYPTVEENKIIETKVIARLKSMGIPDLDFYKAHMKRRLSASLRNTRNWEQNKKAKYMAAKNLLAMAQNTPDESFQVELSAKEADEILRKPVRNLESVRAALAAATLITANTIKSMTVTAAMETYPYLKHPDLLIEDLGNKLELKVTQFKEHFEGSLVFLARMMLVEEDPEDELSKVKLWHKIYEYLQKNDRNFPCIQLCDVSIRGNEVLDKIPNGQAPALILSVDDRDIISAVVVLNKEPLYTMMAPKAFECLALLLAPYFIFSIKYPPAYNKFLLTLEYILCGEDQISQISKDVQTFFQRFFDAKQLL